MTPNQYNITPDSIQVIVNPNDQTDPVITDLQRNLIELSQPFNYQLSQIRSLVDNTKDLLKLNDEKFDLTDLDEHQLEDALVKLDDTTQLFKDVTTTKAQIKTNLNNYVATFITKIESVLADAGFNDLDLLKTEATRIKSEMLNLRKQSAWFSCFDVYSNALLAYPIVQQVFPNLSKFDAFERIVNQRALFKPSANKAFKITAAINNSITELAANLNSLANSTIQELEKLPKETHATIIMTVSSNPTVETLYKQVQYTHQTLEAKKLREDQLKKAKAEQKLLANAQQTHNAIQELNSNTPQLNNSVDTEQQSTQPLTVTLPLPINDNGQFFNNASMWLQQQYIPTYVNTFYDVTTNDNTKLMLIQTLVSDLQNSNSELAKIINGNASAALTVILSAMNL